MKSQRLLPAVAIVTLIIGCSNPEQPGAPVDATTTQGPSIPNPQPTPPPDTVRATLEITVRASGTNTPQEIGVQVIRDSIIPFQMFEVLRIGVPKDFQVPLGVYVARLGANNCTLLYATEEGDVWFVVFSTQGSRLTLSLVCF